MKMDRRARLAMIQQMIRNGPGKIMQLFFVSSRRRHTILVSDWSSDVCSSDLLVVDKYARVARANGSEADLGSFTDAVEQTLIVHGTRDDSAANREAAEACQKAIRARSEERRVGKECRSRWSPDH